MMLLLLFGGVLLASLINYSTLNGPKSLRYRSWYRPWLLMLVIAVFLAFKPQLEAQIVKHIYSASYAAELIFILGIFQFWIVFVKPLLAAFSVDDRVEKLLKKYNVNELLKVKRGFANHLVWPYFIDGFGIFNKPGFKYFKTLLKVSLVLIILAYAWNIYKFNPESLFFIPTAFGLLSIPVLIEWLLYFNCSISKNPDFYDTEIEKKQNVKFYNLFKRYINKEHGFYDSIIFGHIKNNPTDTSLREKENKQYIDGFIDDFKNKNKDFIVSSNDLLISIPKFSEIFFDTLKKGGNVLILADIPGHTKFKPKDVGVAYDNQDNFESVAKIFSVYLQQITEKQIPSAEKLMEIGYFDKNNRTGENKRIILSSVQDALDDALIHSNWIKELDLVVVMQFNDAYANNLLLKRQLSLWLDEQKNKYKSVFFKVFRTSGDEAITNTWMTIVNPAEAKIENIPSARLNYYLNFAFEKSPENLSKIFKGESYSYDFSPGIELSVFAVMENVNHIHYFEGYQLDYIQSKNKLASSQTALIRHDADIDNQYNYGGKVTQYKLTKAIVVNNLPFIVRGLEKENYCEEKHLSVIYDIENNAPKMYQKYRHLGRDESFVCIVSKPHLYREFFAEQLNYFVDVTLEALEPQLSKSNINLCLQLFHLMKHEKIEISYIRYLINLHAVDDLQDTAVLTFISGLFKKYLHLDLHTNSMLKSASEVVFRGGKYEEVQTLSIDNQESATNEIFDYMEEIKVVDNSRNILLSMPKYLLFQNILPQQNIIINGSSFQYNHYDQRTRELVLESVATDNQTYYKPVANLLFANSNIEAIDIPSKTNFTVKRESLLFSSEIFEQEIEISYTKYYRFESDYNSPFAEKNPPQYVDLTKNEIFKNISKRKYITRYVKLHWDLAAGFTSKKEELTTKLHHLLYEFMPILFPYRHQYIQVISNNTYDKKHREALPWIFPEHNLESNDADHIEIYIAEDSFSDLGILKPMQTKTHLEYILKNLYDLLLWIKDDKECHSSNYIEYVKGQGFYKDKLRFLSYGLTDDDIAWDLDLLLDFLKTNAFFSTENIEANHKKRCNKNEQNIDVACDYCNQTFELSKVQIMEDGLHRCQNCSIDAIDTEAQVRELEEEAFDLYSTFLDLDIDKKSLPYKLKFVTATSLHQYYGKPFYITNKFDKREAAGLASDREIDVIHIEKYLTKAQTLSIIIHEIMHIYQYQRLNYFKLQNREVELVEGMTTWVENYILTQSGIPEYMEYARIQKEHLKNDSSIYGVGYRHVLDTYGEDKDVIAAISKRYKL